MRNFSTFVRAGGKVAMGNDGGYLSGLEIGMPISELEAMQEAGMTPMQVIVSATKTAGEVCGLGRLLGTIEAGKLADLLIVSGDPLDSLRALLDVAWVIPNHNLFVQGVFTPLTRHDSLTPYLIDEFGIMLALATAALAWAFWRRRKEVEDIPPSQATREKPTIVPDTGV